MTSHSTHFADPVTALYEPLVADARSCLDQRTGLLNVTDPRADSEILELFLIAFCSLGVQMTRPVESWIDRAGMRCIDVGLEHLGEALVRHAKHEADHHKMMIADTRSLVGEWNKGHASGLSASELLDREPTGGVRNYVALHEQVIASAAPYGQLAIEYEIERLSVQVGPRVMGNIAAVCGPRTVGQLTFLADHLELDKAHTALNHRQLTALLSEHPEFASELGCAGSAALDAYGQFLNDCWEWANGLSLDW